MRFPIRQVGELPSERSNPDRSPSDDRIRSAVSLNVTETEAHLSVREDKDDIEYKFSVTQTFQWKLLSWTGG